MIGVMLFFAGAMLGILSCLVITAHGYKFTPKSANIFSINWDIARMSDLSPYEFFRAVTAWSLRPNEGARKWFERNNYKLTSAIVMYEAWKPVCNAYVQRFGAYPTEDDIKTRVKDIGPQNVEFLINYQKLYLACIKNINIVSLEFAKEFFIRNPSMVDRILPYDGFSGSDAPNIYNEVVAALP